jgi:hypothetical protein
MKREASFVGTSAIFFSREGFAVNLRWKKIFHYLNCAANKAPARQEVRGVVGH